MYDVEIPELTFKTPFLPPLSGPLQGNQLTSNRNIAYFHPWFFFAWIDQTSGDDRKLFLDVEKNSQAPKVGGDSQSERISSLGIEIRVLF